MSRSRHFLHSPKTQLHFAQPSPHNKNFKKISSCRQLLVSFLSLNSIFQLSRSSSSLPLPYSSVPVNSLKIETSFCSSWICVSYANNCFFRAMVFRSSSLSARQKEINNRISILLNLYPLATSFNLLRMSSIFVCAASSSARRESFSSNSFCTSSELPELGAGDALRDGFPRAGDAKGEFCNDDFGFSRSIQSYFS